MGCLLALVFMGMAGGGGYFWATTGNFLWGGLVCIIGLIGLFCYLVALTKGAALGGLDDIGDIFDGFN